MKDGTEFIDELKDRVHELYDENKRLKEELKYTIPIVEHNKTITKHLKEIERLKELCNKYEEEHKTVFEEWKKTINIINELEKYLDEALGQDMYRYDFKIILDKLQELKEEVKKSENN